MGCTLAVAWARAIAADRSRWIVAHVGDSPIYAVTPAGTRQLTVDHTVPGHLVANGTITAEAARTHPYRNQLLRALGHEPAVEPDVATLVLSAGDALVLASDGLSGVLEPDDVHGLVAAALVAPRHVMATELAERLADAALARGATDNVTVAVLRHLATSGDARPVRRLRVRRRPPR
jgi:protein phosphatase